MSKGSIEFEDLGQGVQDIMEAAAIIKHVGYSEDSNIIKALRKIQYSLEEQLTMEERREDWTDLSATRRTSILGQYFEEVIPIPGFEINKLGMIRVKDRKPYDERVVQFQYSSSDPGTEFTLLNRDDSVRLMVMPNALGSDMWPVAYLD